MRASLPTLCLVLLTAAVSVRAQQPLALLQQGRVDEMLARVDHSKDAASRNLLCRAYYWEGHYDEAVRECEAAANAVPGNSMYRVWLGRAYGLKASHSSALTAFNVARKSHAAMAHAAELDPRNADALSDMADFCIAAPEFLCGGVGKANELAQKLLALDAPRGHRILAEIAEKQKFLPEAEREYTAASTGAHTAAGLVDLGEYYKRHGSKAQVLAVVRKVDATDHARTNSVADAAGLLVETGQEPKLAEQLYRSYLDGPSRSEEAPAFQILTELGNLLASQGDAVGAQRQYAAALALAHNYAPAQQRAAALTAKSSTGARR